jgi:hypothetical protein
MITRANFGGQVKAADNLAYECRRLVITEQSKLPERVAMTRLKERIYKIYRMDYNGLKVIMENQQPNIIPIAPETVNPINEGRKRIGQRTDRFQPPYGAGAPRV